MLKSTHETYYSNIFKDCKTDTKSLYCSINKITRNINDNVYLLFANAEKIADFYNKKVLIISKISSNKSLTTKHKTNLINIFNDSFANSLLLFETDSNNTSSEFSEVTPNLLFEIIMTMPNKSSMNDPMPLPFVKSLLIFYYPFFFTFLLNH